MQLKQIVAFVALILAAGVGQAQCQRVSRAGVIPMQALLPTRRQPVGNLFVAHSVLIKATSNPSEADRGGIWGAGIGAVVGGGTGLLIGLSDCDAAGSHRGCITEGAVGGVIIGAVIGYGVGWIIGNYH